MNITSEYSFPIFISSTDYNLKDLRAELASFLNGLGYRPILSSAQGFPDNSPNLEPWESCIPVLDKSFVMILVIDGKYGSKFSWPNIKEWQDKRMSPTHGEYFYAHSQHKRMLVFIRAEVMTYYQSYRNTLKKHRGDITETKKVLDFTLPDYIDFEVLQFIDQVKTTKPIPWIKEFNDVTDIKNEVQRKMLNELAELFLVKELFLETVIDSFNKVMSTLNFDSQRDVISKLNLPKEFSDAFDGREILNEKLKVAEETLDKQKENKEEHAKEVRELKGKIKQLEQQTLEIGKNGFFIDNGFEKVKSSPYFTNSVVGADMTSFQKNLLTSEDSLWPKDTISLANMLITRCDKCKKISSGSINYTLSALHLCSGCNRRLCNDCWPKYITGTFSITNPDKCPECTKARNSNITS